MTETNVPPYRDLARQMAEHNNEFEPLGPIDIDAMGHTFGNHELRCENKSVPTSKICYNEWGVKAGFRQIQGSLCGVSWYEHQKNPAPCPNDPRNVVKWKKWATEEAP